MTLEQLFANSTIDVPSMLKQLKQTAVKLGLPFGKREKTFNSRLAQELGLWAESKGKGDEFHREAFQAYFARGENLAKKDVLSRIVESTDLDTIEAEAVVEERRFQAEVDDHWKRSQNLQITAVPTFFFHDQKLVGAQPYEELERFLIAYGVQKK